jgi:hypothetical protein
MDINQKLRKQKDVQVKNSGNERGSGNNKAMKIASNLPGFLAMKRVTNSKVLELWVACEGVGALPQLVALVPQHL